MRGSGGGESICVLCWAPIPKLASGDVDSVLKRFLECAQDLSLSPSGVTNDGVNFCKKCLSDVNSAADKGGQVAEMEGKVRELQRELLENLRILLTLTDNYLRRMSTLEGTIKKSPPPEKLLGRGRRQRGGKDSGIQFRDGVLSMVRELQRCRGELNTKLSISAGEVTTPTPHNNHSSPPTKEQRVQPKTEVELSSDEEEQEMEDNFMDQDYEPEPADENEDANQEDTPGSDNHPPSSDQDEEMATDDKNLDSDSEMKKEGTPPECSICHKTFTRWSTVKKHKRDVHQPRMSCPVCNKHILVHRLEHHQANQCKKEKPESSAKPLCDICNKSFTRWETVKKHKLSVHQPRMSCPVCNKHILVHRLEHHQANECQKKRKPRPSVSHTCDICNKVFRRGWELKRHQRVHQDQVPCNLCQMLVWPHRMKHHRTNVCNNKNKNPSPSSSSEQTVHNTKPPETFKCTTCGASFRARVYLRKHRRRVHEGKPDLSKPKKCNHCGKWLSSNGFSGHVKYHCSGRPKEELVTMICEGCGITIRGRYAMRKHMLISCPSLAKKGDFRCEFCGKGGFATKQYLEFHMERHKVSAMTTKPYLCVLCGRGFNSGTALNRHSKICDGTKKPRRPRRNMLTPLPPTPTQKNNEEEEAAPQDTTQSS